ncbi:hypothetical protein [Micromonospora gifhornensis]|uniref:hypothetical protein n=1 Tax=Micromonospora gifhornensis TaxID=84594 RepID=UPI0036694B3C
MLGRPWSVDQLTAFRAKMPDRYRVSVDLGAGCGLWQGGIFGMSPADLDPTRPVLHVVRQVKLVRGALIFAPPKTGDPVSVTLYLTDADDLPLSRSKFNPGVWKHAIRATGIPDDRRNGMHVLRHTYASVLLDAGESIKALSTYLGTPTGSGTQ